MNGDRGENQILEQRLQIIPPLGNGWVVLKALAMDAYKELLQRTLSGHDTIVLIGYFCGKLDRGNAPTAHRSLDQTFFFPTKLNLLSKCLDQIPQCHYHTNSYFSR